MTVAGQPIPASARIVSVVASTAVALACGTNRPTAAATFIASFGLTVAAQYAYSAWGPEFSERLGLSATQSNIIGVAGNMGMYCSGIPAGLLVDNRGPRWGVVVGAMALACGYFPIYQAYQAGPGGSSLTWVSIYSFLTGLGSCTAFSAAVKTSTFNWPNHRGTASAFPLSAFGLSAFFFAALGNVLFAGQTGGFLLMLAVGTVSMNLAALPFMRLLSNNHAYAALGDHDADSGDAREGSVSSRNSLRHQESTSEQLGKHGDSKSGPATELGFSEPDSGYGTGAFPHSRIRPGTCSRMSASSAPADVTHTSIELSGVALLRHVEFWQLFVMMALLAGVGLMTINNIGNDTKALWKYFDPSKSTGFVQAQEQLQVSILSIGSFGGRFLSGVGSDYLVKRLHASRFWCLVASAAIFTAAQLLALFVFNPHFLFLISSLVGLGYGALFGVFPSLAADSFGVQGLSLNWGYLIVAPVISGNIFNLFYGRVFDHHSTMPDGAKSECREGLECYREAYFLTLASSAVGLLMALWCVRYEARNRLRAHRVSES